MQGNHAGQWLRRYKDLPPDQQQKALDNDPQFRSLPPARQQILRERLQRFSSLPPRMQDRILQRMETWEHLTPAQKQQARQLYSQLKDLPPERRQKVRTAIRDLSVMPPARASAGHRVGSFQERVLAPGARPAQQRLAVAAGPGDWAERARAGRIMTTSRHEPLSGHNPARGLWPTRKYDCRQFPRRSPVRLHFRDEEEVIIWRCCMPALQVTRFADCGQIRSMLRMSAV